MFRNTAFLAVTLSLLVLAGFAALALFPMSEGRNGVALAAIQAASGAPVAKPTPPPVPLPPPVTQVLQSGVLIVVSKASQQMFVFKDGVLWGASPVSTGKRGHATPSGIFPILQKAVYHRSNLYSNAPMPYMQRLTWSGIAIHAGYLPGYPASHGCIRLPKAFAKALFALTKAGSTTVVVTNDVATSEDQARQLALAMPMPGAGRAPMARSDSPSVPKIRPLPLVPIQGPGQTIQLSAATSPAEAEAHWARLVASHPELGSFRKDVIPAVVGNRRVYRLRATAPGAHATCAALKRAGEACFNVS